MKRFALLGGIGLLFSLALASNAPAVDTPVAAQSGPNVRALAMAGNRVALRVLRAPDTWCRGADDPDARPRAQERAMRCMVNYAREQAGLRRLNTKRKLNRAADRKAADILRCDDFSHQACGRDFLYWFRRGGYLRGHCWWAGENLAWGSGGLGTARSVMTAWLRSRSHRANLLDSDYRQFGISLREGALSGGRDAHVWVNHFGRHC
ncbi:MAG: CAP domain-containing protein [Solirubrobacterales bacterium]